jgi:PAS domain S-box-containing protein
MKPQNEAYFRTLIEGIPDMVTILDKDGTIHYVNPSIERVSGYQPEEVVGQKVFDFIHSKDRARVKEAFEEIMRNSDEVASWEFCFHHKNGFWQILEARGKNLFPKNLAVPGIILSCRDITERKQVEEKMNRQNESPVTLQETTPARRRRVEEELKRAQDYLEIRVKERTAELVKINEELRTEILERKRIEETLRILEKAVETLPLGVTITNPEGKILYTNPAEANMHGYTVEELIGKNARIFAPSELWKPMGPEQVKQRTHWRRETVNVRKDGSIFPVQLVSDLVKDASGNPVAVFTICEDITERKQAEEELKTFAAKLEQKTRELHEALEKEKELGELKSRFVSMASHEFRTPLASILAASDILKRYGDRMTSEQKMERLNKIQAEIRHMTRLLEDILLIGKAEAGKLEFNPILLNLRKFCQDLVHEMEVTTQTGHKVVFSYRVPYEEVSLDEKLMRHIIINLLSNAVKYSPAGSTVYLNVSGKEGGIIFQIQDEGIGIPEEDQKRLFEPFHRARNVGDISGTGLGLAILKKAVDLHGGTIHVDSKEGCGTTFTITIPTGERSPSS